MASGGARTSTKWPSTAAAAAIAGLTRCVRPPGALATLEVAVRRRRATLAGLEAVVVHREAHRAAGLAPLEARGEEHLVEALGFGLRLSPGPSRHDHRELHVRRDVPAARDRARRRAGPRCAELVHEPMNTLSIAMSVIGVLGFKSHVLERSLDRRSRRRVALALRDRARGRRPARPSRATCPRSPAAAISGGIEHERLVERAPSSLCSVRQCVTALSHWRPRRERPAAQVVERRLVGGDQPARAPASIAMLQIVMRPSIDSARIVDAARTRSRARCRRRCRSGR